MKISRKHLLGVLVGLGALLQLALQPGMARADEGGTPNALRPVLSREMATQQCLARANQLGKDVPATSADTLTPDQWRRFAHCAIGINIRFAPGSIDGNSSATVQIDLNDDGKVESLALESTGDVNWGKVVQRAIDAMPALPPAPVSRTYRSVRLEYRLGHVDQGIAGTSPAPMLIDTSRWSLHHCVGVGNASTCN